MARLRSIIGILLIAGSFYVGISLLPAYYANRELQLFVTDLTVKESYSPHTENEVAQQVVAKAQELSIPLTFEQVTVRRDNAGLSVLAEYSVQVDLRVKKLELNMKAEASNQKTQGITLPQQGG